MKYPIRQFRNNLYHFRASLTRYVYKSFYGMNIGDNTRISRTAKLDKTNPRGVDIGQSTSISFHASILTHDFVNNRHVKTKVGDRCFIGAHVIVLPGVTIGDECIIGAGSVVMSDIPSHSIAVGNPAKVIRTGIRTREYGALLSVQQSKKNEALVDGQSARGVPQVSGAMSHGHRNLDIYEYIKSELQVDDVVMTLPVAETAVDSFALITLRSGIESRFSVEIPDDEWINANTLAEISKIPSLNAGRLITVEADRQKGNFLGAAVVLNDLAGQSKSESESADNPSVASAPLKIVRTGCAAAVHSIDMPQMALSGLNEAWLLKEVGHVHWTMISDFLQCPSSQIADGGGERLYATFTRLAWAAPEGLRSFCENDLLTHSARLSRYGSGFYFSQQTVSKATSTLEFTVMSTFAKHGERGANTSLVKGTPILPNPDAIPVSQVLPEFGLIYRKQRSLTPEDHIFECEYEILPPHDINGVGLLYFAAYPIIFDLCIEKFEGKGFLRSHTSTSKDICYFANAEPDETLIFRLHTREEMQGSITHFSSLYRKSDNQRMAQVVSTKMKV